MYTREQQPFGLRNDDNDEKLGELQETAENLLPALPASFPNMLNEQFGSSNERLETPTSREIKEIDIDNNSGTSRESEIARIERFL